MPMAAGARIVRLLGWVMPGGVRSTGASPPPPAWPTRTASCEGSPLSEPNTQTPQQTPVRTPEPSQPGGASARVRDRAADPLGPTDTFVHRHIGPDEAEVAEMLGLLGYDSLEALTDAAVPESIRTSRPLEIGPARGEHELLAELRSIAQQNQLWRTYIGMGYVGTIVPAVIQRNVLENPAGTRRTRPTRPRSARAGWRPC
ncbi:MAG: hypothetical protein KatS3mg103_0455 [Phycisphaerales bacterium]|nr:MAG: hypothetical protein KatS3mg103_0455 [Phycisphaerales bacterium]